MIIISKLVKQILVFHVGYINFVFRDTYLKKLGGELVNDYNDRCIRRAVSWYMEHVPDEYFVFVSDDAKNRSLALEEGIPACSGKCKIQNLKRNIY